ncbi:MAG: hypothetical protein HONBIEJF_02280 [Fimbriimonadaceae bacterium]|nr:hypothetical protein [Fimbriimonadaceae bacterium]
MPEESLLNGKASWFPAIAGVGWGAILFAILATPSGMAPVPPGDPLNGAAEPRIGMTKLRLEPREVKGKAIHANQSDLPILVVAAGTCSGCQLGAIPYDRIDTAAYSRIVFIYRTERSKIERQPIHSASNVLTLSDMSLAHYQALNAYWEPRYYLFDRNLTLRAKQEDPNHLPEFVRLTEADGAMQRELVAP